MNQANQSPLIQEWSDVGLNIYLSIPIIDLPEEFKKYLESISIDLNNFKSMVLIGNGGSKFGKNFSFPLISDQDPIDSFSISQINKLNNPFILYPNNNLIPPLQKISRFFNLSHQSPLGIDISFEYGLWFAIRGLFLTKELMPISMLDSFESPCESCQTKDCLLACPANAASLIQFDLKKCTEHRLILNSSCSDRCLSRLTCPYQQKHQYILEQTKYHMINSLKFIQR